MNETEKKDLKLKPEVAEKYNLVGAKVGTSHFSGFGQINLAEVDLKRADALFAREFPHFELKKKETAPVAEKAKVQQAAGASDTASAKA